MWSSSSFGLAFFLHLFLPIDILFAFDRVLTERYGVCICETYPEETESQGKAPVVFASNRQSPSCWVSTSADLSDFELPSFARLRFSSRHCESHAEPKCSLEVLALQTAPQAKCDSLSDMPFTMADGNGPHLHPWCQAAADFSAELSATMELSRWTSVLPGRPVPSQSEVPSQVSKPSKEITKRRQRQGQCRIWTVLSVPVLSALATSGISYGPSIATTEWSTASVGSPWCTEQYDADAERFSAAAVCSCAGLCPFGNAYACNANSGARGGAERTAQLFAEALCGFTSGCATKSPDRVEEARKEGYQGSSSSSQVSGRGPHCLRRSPGCPYPAYQLLEILFGRGCEKLDGLCQAFRTARTGLTVENFSCKGPIPGSQGMPRCFQNLCRTSHRDQRRGGTSGRLRKFSHANHRKYPDALQLLDEALQRSRVYQVEGPSAKRPRMEEKKEGLAGDGSKQPFS